MRNEKIKTTCSASRNFASKVALFSVVVCTLFNISSAVSAPVLSKSDALRNLREWRGRVVGTDEKLSNDQKKIVTTLSKITLKRETADLENPLAEIAKLDAERVEIEARRRIIDQIIFAVDTKWSGADLRGFLETQLLELAVTDLSEPGQGGWWKFLIQASISLRETAEPGADPIRFLEAYTSESGVLEPKSAFDVLKTRNYVGD